LSRARLWRNLALSHDRPDDRPLRGPRASRGRGDGCRLPGPGHQARSPGRPQVPVPGPRRKRDGQGAVHGRGPGRLRSRPRQHRDDPRHRRDPGRGSLHRHGLIRGRDGGPADRPRPPASPRSGRGRRPGRGGPGPGPRAGHRAPRCEAGQPPGDIGARRQGPRLRAGEDGGHPPHRRGDGGGDTRLHVTGAGAGTAGRSPNGHLEPGRRPLRDAQRASSLPRRIPKPDPRGHSRRGAGFAATARGGAAPTRAPRAAHPRQGPRGAPPDHGGASRRAARDPPGSRREPSATRRRPSSPTPPGPGSRGPHPRRDSTRRGSGGRSRSWPASWYRSCP
jgi:hypothetical protein